MASIIAELYEDSKIQSDYGETGSFDMPMHEKIDPKLKSEAKYCVDITKSGFSLLMRNRSALPGSAYRYIQLLRDYGTGNQPEDLYVNMFRKGKSGETDTSQAGYDTDGVWTQTPQGRREGIENLSTQVVSVATNLKSALHGIFSSYDENIYVNNLDNTSIAAEEERMYGALFDAENLDFIKTMRDQYGVDLMGQDKLPGDVTLEELQVYKDMGGFRSEWAWSMEQLIKYTELESGWEETIKRKWVDDIFDLNTIAGRCYYDSETGEERWGYCDPANTTMQYSINSDFDDSDYGGYFTLERFSKLSEKGFPRDKLISAARRYEYFFGNLRGLNWNDITAGNFYDDRLSRYQIPVFHYYWKDVDVKRTLKVKNEYGRETNYDIEFEKEVKPLSDYRKKKGIKQNERKTRIRRTYQCSWVVDTDMAYDYGISPCQGRKSKKEPIIPVFMWRGVTTNENTLFGSLVESIVPFLDNLQLAWLKYQESLIRSNSGGYLINLRLLQNLEIGGKKITPIDAFEMFWRTGKMPYMDSPLGENYKGGSVLPMTRIEGDAGELMAITSNQIHFNLSMIEKITGINPAPLGQSPDKDQPVSSVRMSSMGTNNVIRPMFNGIYKMKEKLADLTTKRIQLLLRNNSDSRKSYGRIIGDRSVEILSKMERLGSEYGIYMDARPSEEEITLLMNGVEEALSPGRDGKIDINLSQYMYIVEQIRSGGNIKKLSRDLSFLIRRNEQERAQAHEASIRAQTQQQAQMKQSEAQLDLVKEKAKTASQMAIDDNEAKNEAKLKQLEANLKYEESLVKQKQNIQNARFKSSEQRRSNVPASA